MNTKDTVMIFGGTGLLGDTLTKELKKSGYTDVFSLSSDDVDVINIDSVDEILWQWKPKIVINAFVVFGGIVGNERNRAAFFYDNMQGNLNIIESCRTHKVEKLINIGSQCSYGHNSPVPFQEKDLWQFGLPTDNNSSYGIVKRSIYLMLEAYYRQYGFKSATIIPSNMYGGTKDNWDDESNHVIPALVKRIVKAKEDGLEEVTILGSGQQTREFLHVKDCSRAIIDLIEKDVTCEVMNIGSDQEVTISHLAELIKKEVGYTGNLVYNNNKEIEGQSRRISDLTRIKEFLNYAPKIKIEEGIKEVVSFYLNNRDNLRKKRYYE